MSTPIAAALSHVSTYALGRRTVGSSRAPGSISRSSPLRGGGGRVRMCWQPAQQGGSSRGAAVARATATETLVGDELAAWEDSVEMLQSLGFDADGANTILERSFGWGKPSQGFWRGEVVEVVPSVEQIQRVVDYLNELGIKGQDLNFYVNKFPNVFGCSVDGLLKANVTELEKTWKIKGATLAATLRRRPEILGYNLDCYGDCKGECNRCWVRF
eukprot:CAMPEP_0177757636 /NCGR_PEP_ID=MMETSP0491_2-20121128/3748_1 /TAXON_ID=63592 /ORGANISM="Tetraselmis chuii, Strain PLY429" /LENGTH=214 /DNA_ID=CAMNT_0019273299 /DNA_START=352 /DNA_END=996 /DNA_ORIENTATION=+